MLYRVACLAGSPACSLLQSLKSARSSVSSWEELGGLSPLQRPSRSLHRGLWPAAVCDLRVASRALGAGDSDFHGFTEAPSICLGSWDERCALGTPLCLLPWQREGAFQRERQRPSPTCLRTAASLGQQERIFQDTCHMLRGPRKEKFP